MNRTDKALKAFERGSACSQAVATAFAAELGLDERMIHRIATGFGGGIGSKQYTCGAVTGGVLVLSARFGSEVSDEVDAKAEAKARTAAFVDAVEARLGSSSCGEILGTSMEDAAERGLFRTVCPNVVQACVEELEKLM
jgi:C_GCAxxG_C_C family probable redox protein